MFAPAAAAAATSKKRTRSEKASEEVTAKKSKLASPTVRRQYDPVAACNILIEQDGLKESLHAHLCDLLRIKSEFLDAAIEDGKLVLAAGTFKTGEEMESFFDLVFAEPDPVAFTGFSIETSIATAHTLDCLGCDRHLKVLLGEKITPAILQGTMKVSDMIAVSKRYKLPMQRAAVWAVKPKDIDLAPEDHESLRWQWVTQLHLIVNALYPANTDKALGFSRPGCQAIGCPDACRGANFTPKLHKATLNKELNQWDLMYTGLPRDKEWMARLLCYLDSVLLG